MKKFLVMILVLLMAFTTACATPGTIADDDHINTKMQIYTHNSDRSRHDSTGIIDDYKLLVKDENGKHLVEICFSDNVGTDAIKDIIFIMAGDVDLSDYVDGWIYNSVLHTNPDRTCCVYVTEEKYQELKEWEEEDYIDSVTKIADLKETSFYKKNGYLKPGDGTAGVLTNNDPESDYVYKTKKGQTLKVNLPICYQRDDYHDGFGWDYELLVKTKNEYLVEVSFVERIGVEKMKEEIAGCVKSVNDSDYIDASSIKSLFGTSADSNSYLYVTKSEYKKLVKWAEESEQVKSVFKLVDFEDTYYYNHCGYLPIANEERTMKMQWDYCQLDD